MNLKQFVTDDDAVSPVIGVILMVAITVILAAVIGAFVLDLGGSQDTAPSVTWEYDWDGSALTITHNGGDQVQANTLTVTVKGGSDIDTGDGFFGVGATSKLSAGASGSSSSVSAGDTIQIVWDSPDSGTSSVIGTYEVPN